MGLDNKNMTCAGITSQEAKQAFLSDGVIVLRRAVTRQWVARIRDALEADIRNPGPYVHSYTPRNGHGRFHGNLRT